MNNRYPYLRANVLRKIRDLNQIVEGCDAILKRFESTLLDTHRGSITQNIGEEEKVARLRKRVKDAIIHLKVGTE